MINQRTIVSIGEALLCEYPDRVEPGGLAVQYARHAVRIGHKGVIVSRIGQDRAADELLELLRSMPINLESMQSDPDLPTGRFVVRTVAGKPTRVLSARAAFDNLQWDFDLVDVAQQADAVVFGSLARREGQSRTIIKRLLAECTSAVRVFDMVNRAGETVDRIEALSGLEFAEGVIADAAALKALLPSWDGGDVNRACAEIMRGRKLLFVVGIERGDCSERMSVHADNRCWQASQPHASSLHEAAMLGMLHGVLRGWDFARSLETAVRVADHATSHPTETMSGLED